MSQESEEKPLNFEKCVLYTNNPSAARYLYREIFEEGEYPFQTTKENPYIIDCGANIGCSTIYFKSLFPKSRILCFEPDPKMYYFLCKNIKANQLYDVQTVCTALSSDKGKVSFYGQFEGPQTDSLGNSLIQEWGHKTYTDVIEVDCVKLSTYIDREVDFLKLDIEGAEQVVLEDLEQSGKINFISAMSIEVHETPNMVSRNSLAKVKKILNRQNFEYSIKEHNPDILLPEKLHSWAKKHHPKIYVVNARRVS